jgi:hypothetical protein
VATEGRVLVVCRKVVTAPHKFNLPQAVIT